MPSSNVKPGWRTSEFWVSVVGAFIPLLNNGLGWNLDSTSIMAVMAPIVGYVVSRFVVKSAASRSA